MLLFEINSFYDRSDYYYYYYFVYIRFVLAWNAKMLKFSKCFSNNRCTTFLNIVFQNTASNYYYSYVPKFSTYLCSILIFLLLLLSLSLSLLRLRSGMMAAVVKFVVATTVATILCKGGGRMIKKSFLYFV